MLGTQGYNVDSLFICRVRPRQVPKNNQLFLSAVGALQQSRTVETRNDILASWSKPKHALRSCVVKSRDQSLHPAAMVCWWSVNAKMTSHAVGMCGGLLEVEVYLSRGNISYPDCATLTAWEVLFDYSSRNPAAIIAAGIHRLSISGLLKQKRLRLKIHMSGVQMKSFFGVAASTGHHHDTGLGTPTEPLRSSLCCHLQKRKLRLKGVTFLRHMTGNQWAGLDTYCALRPRVSRTTTVPSMHFYKASLRRNKSPYGICIRTSFRLMSLFLSLSYFPGPFLTSPPFPVPWPCASIALANVHCSGSTCYFTATLSLLDSRHV